MSEEAKEVITVITEQESIQANQVEEVTPSESSEGAVVSESVKGSSTKTAEVPMVVTSTKGSASASPLKRSLSSLTANEQNFISKTS